jgi:hypothetical protein
MAFSTKAPVCFQAKSRCRVSTVPASENSRSHFRTRKEYRFNSEVQPRHARRQTKRKDQLELGLARLTGQDPVVSDRSG